MEKTAMASSTMPRFVWDAQLAWQIRDRSLHKRLLETGSRRFRDIQPYVMLNHVLQRTGADFQDRLPWKPVSPHKLRNRRGLRRFGGRVRFGGEMADLGAASPGCVFVEQP
ncbi:MAG: hypothetical protein ACLQGV_07105 [Bryobacteraceae bacterium]